MRKAIGKINAILAFILVLFILNDKGYAQGQNNNWYFGNQAGVVFNNGTIGNLIDGAINTTEGTAVASDSLGNLLFYTDGSTVYTRNHTIMPNGINLGSTAPSTQAALIVPLPDSDSIYYIFSVDVEGRAGGLQIAIVDLSLNGGIGEIISKNDTLEPQTTEKLTGVFHQNGTDIWVLTHSLGSNAFNAYLITPTGLNRTPIVSHSGNIHDLGINGSGAIGYMRFSHDGTRLAVAIWQGLQIVEIFDFNTVSGEVSNPVQIGGFTNAVNNGPYGLEFSPNGNYLYVSESNLGTPQSRVLQYDLTETDIPASVLVIVESPLNFGTLLLGSDQKIYLSINGQSFLSEISNPNARGVASNFQFNTVDLQTGRLGYGFPNFLRGFLTIIDYENICLGDTTLFSLQSSIAIREARWDFGDMTPIDTNLSPKHLYLDTGLYDISVELDYENGVTQIINAEIRIDEAEATLLPFPVFCLGPGSYGFVEGQPAGGRYEGPGVDSDLGTFQPILVGPGSFPINYIYTNENDCVDTATQNITVVSSTSVGVVSLVPPNYCPEEAPIILDIAQPLGGFYLGTGITNDSIFSPELAGIGNHNVSYTFIDANGCESTVDFIITVFQPISAGLTAPPTACILDDTFQILRTSTSGTFQGDGIIDTLLGLYLPQTSGIGIDTIIHSYNDVNGCLSMDTIFINVADTLSVTFNALPDICLNATPIALNAATPGGGTYSGPGVSSNIFNPFNAGVGTHKLRYIFNLVNGCGDTAFQNITVIQPPPITNFPLPNLCTNTDTLPLNFFSPPGGDYLFLGNIVTEIIPTELLSGNYTLFYRYIDPMTGCISVDNETFSVHDLSPVLVLQDTLFLCLTDDLIHLTGVNPVGGVFTGTGVVFDTLFNILQAGIGVHNLQYNYTNVNFCTTQSDFIVSVLDTPNVVFNPLPNLCTSDGTLNLSNFVNIRGGTFMGPATDPTGLFYPSLAGSGDHVLTYTYVDANGCSSTIQEILNILDATPISQTPVLGNFCIDSDSIFLIGQMPIGGVYSGNGYNPNSNYFNPRSAGIGIHNLIYTFTSGNSCVSADTQEIYIYPQPPVFLPDYLESCTANPITLNAFHPSHTSTTTYLWSTGDTTSSIQVSNLGTNMLTVEVVNHIGGITCISRDTSIVQINATPFLDLPQTIITACIPDSVILDAFHPSHIGRPLRYTWSTGDTSSQVVIKNIGSYVYTISIEDTLTGCSNTDILDIIIGTLPIVDLGNDIIACQNDAPIFLDAANSSHNSQTQYLWQDRQTTSSLRLNHIGSQTSIVQVTDGLSGCFSFDSIEVTIRPSPVIVLNDTINICTRDLPFTIDANHSTHNQNVIYNWSNGDTTSFTNLTFEGNFNYFLKITDTLTGCFSEKRIYISVLPPPVADLGQDRSFCFSEGGSILDAFLPSHEGRNFKYIWSTGDTTQSILVNTIGAYSVQIIDRNTGCEDRDSINVLLYPALNIDLGEDRQLCLGTHELQLNAFDISHTGQNIRYEWNTGQLGKSIEVLVKKDTQIVINIFNLETLCRASDTLNITFENMPFVNISDTVLCENTSIILNAFSPSHLSSPVAYLWSTGEITSAIQIDNINSSETYTVRVTDLEQNCYNEDQAVVSFLPAALLDIGNDTSLCQTNLRLDAYHSSHQNDYNYLWNTGDTTPSIIVNTLGNQEYSVQLFRKDNLNNCRVHDTILVNMIEKPISNFSTLSFCEHELPALLLGRDESHPSQFSYSWSTLDGQLLSNTDTLRIENLGTYILEIGDNENLCTTFDTLDVNILPSPLVDIIRFPNPSPESLPARIGLLSSNVENLAVEWRYETEDTNVFLNSAEELNVEVNRYGTYYLKVTNAITGCETLDSFLLFSETPSCKFPNAFTPNDDLRNDYFSPLTSDLQYLELRIYNLEGTEVFSKILDTQKAEWTGVFQETWGWNGKDSSGKDLLEGKYIFKATYNWLNQHGETNNEIKEGTAYLIR